MRKQHKLSKEKELHKTVPPRLEGKAKNAMMFSKRKPKKKPPAKIEKFIEE